MMVRLEKINPFKRQYRFYELSTGQTLFGEWCLTREWGRIGAAGGQKKVDYLTSKEEAELALADLKAAKNKRGYATIPVQLVLFES
jgi:predicted DNA-binding WGR domain protein